MINTYQFIRFNDSTSLNELLVKIKSHNIICIDLEDSVCD